MRDFRGMLAGVGCQARSSATRLRDLPLIAAVEAMHDVRGGSWQPAYDEAVAKASLAYFGVSEGEARPSEPYPDQIEGYDASSCRSGGEAAMTYAAVLTAWENWQATLFELHAEIDRHGPQVFWARLGIDVTDGRGGLLRCLPRFERQLYAAVKGLLPGARFTPEGMGRKAAQSVEDWAAALARDAARFRPTR